jgi:anthranilate phosphoribosyltransferase
MSNLRPLLKYLVEDHGSLTADQASAAVRAILQGEASDMEIAALVTAISARGATSEELAGFVEAMRALGRAVPLTEEERAELVDTCGTGGDDRGTFNISTGAALVAAAAGVKIAKHGNRGVTSKCGSADVLEAMGIPAELEPEDAARCLRATGFTFLYAPLLHPAMKRVQPVRKALGFRSIFNLAAPLTNPAGAKAQLMGIFAAARASIVSETMVKLGVRHAMVVRGADGVDELTLHGASEIAEVRGHNVRIFELDPASAGLQPAPLAAIAGGDARESAAILEGVLGGERGPRRDVVLLNAAAVLIVAGQAQDFPEGVALASKGIDSGAGLRLLIRLRQFQSELDSGSQP